MNRLLNALGTVETRFACVTHVEVTSARAGAQQAWPEWTPEWVRSGYQFLGVSEPWVHQVEAMESGRLGHTVIATSTGSGKSLALWTPVLAALDTPRPLGRITELRSRPAALYLAPTKALAADQDTALTGLFQAAGVPGWLAATCDGDTPRETRRYLQSHADILLTNPDFLHFSLLPAHARWAGLLRGLRYVIIDELHAYRGVMGAHVAWVLRRLRRLARHYGADPVFLAASATVCQPDAALARLIGSEIQQVTAVTEDTSEQGEQTLVLWRPEITADPENVTSPENPANLGNPQPAASPTVGNQAASDWQTDDSDDNAASATETSPIQTETPRRSATLEAARLLADLVDVGARTVVFVRSRYAAEAVAGMAREIIAGSGAANRIASYRGGYLAEERRDLEQRLRNGSLLGLVSTSALELGIDVSGLDAVLIAGWPGTLMALRQQAGRAGRAGQEGLAVWIAGNDPLDSYVVNHPAAVVGAPLEATAFDPSNPYVMAPHLAAAAAERPLNRSELEALDPAAPGVAQTLAQSGVLRERDGNWYWVLPERAADLTDLRGAGGGQIQLVEQTTGRVLGTVDAARAPAAAHPGAIYLHQGESYLVVHLDLEAGWAAVEPASPRYRTMPLDQTRVAVVRERASVVEPHATWYLGEVDVTSQVTGFMRLRVPGLERIGTEKLDLPESTLRTQATWVTIPVSTLRSAGLTADAVPGALHAAEHCGIGLLPLLATCDRWDLGGLSTALHSDTGQATIFIHDALPGGAGFAERAYHQHGALLRAVRDLLIACPCEAGCPACVQSPKCGNGNQMLSKAGALVLVEALIGE